VIVLMGGAESSNLRSDEVLADGGEASTELTEDTNELAFAAQLLAPFGGNVQLNRMQSGCQVVISAPRVGSIPVLVVDDNPDVRRLFQRYTAFSRFQVVTSGASRPTPQAIIDLAQNQHIRAIILDIMMPGVDGWDLLTQLRHHPATQMIPIVVCTILPQRQLAHLLGAAAFLQKPVSQGDLLATLNRITASEGRVPE
jgi:CheY-like chemotaxis protein